MNVFQGSSTIDLPTQEGLAATWHFIKAIAGNTTPAATLPFGKYSCLAYTTGYPAGYGDNLDNYSPWSMKHLPEGARFYGLSHFHQSGVGFIRHFYNYAVLTPYYGEVPDGGSQILEESASPGYYGILSTQGSKTVRSEATVNRDSVFHRFRFSDPGGMLYLNLTNNGLNPAIPGGRGTVDGGRVTLTGNRDLSAEVSLDGRIHFFRFHFEDALILGLSKNRERLDGAELSFGEIRPGEEIGVFLAAEKHTVLSRFSASFVSAERADEAIRTKSGSFEEVRQAADAEWEELLRRIELTGASPEDTEVFYSNLYHTLVKPSDRPGDSPFWDDPTFVTEFCTMWDIYKTQLPLLFTLYPEIGKKILDSFFLYAKENGTLPHTVVLSGPISHEDQQACLLAEHSVADAFFRGIDCDYAGNLDLLLKDIRRPRIQKILHGDLPERLTHFLDAVEACGAVADVAEALGRKDLAEELREEEKGWSRAFDPETGLLFADHTYYEGNVWNYSFRLLRHMDERVSLAGKERMTALLDHFFGFRDPEDRSGRFEGFNNESDMEAPYAYHALGRMDRIAGIMAAMNRFLFVRGRGGIPGNNDSGGLSSCYLWNAMGIFPVTGQNRMLIGSPHFPKVTLHLPGGKDFVIERRGKEGTVVKASLDGEALPDFAFTAARMMQGGKLVLETE
ncbi:MAG: glycoside hydrolase family 92 protein [Lachnospiraceae bacterium]|nr:glycoside hydrolase family 92 protein [Lachnospiraceae bacterium]